MRLLQAFENDGNRQLDDAITMAITCFDTGRTTKFERIASCVEAGMMFDNHPARRSLDAADIMTRLVVFVHLQQGRMAGSFAQSNDRRA